jgi:type VI secretion system ImpM family protein
MNQSTIGGPIGTGCFGKRQPAGDYIHHHQGGPGILDWQRWIHDGVGLASARFGAAVEPLLRDLRVFQFAFPSARSDSYLFGALGPGQDRSGRLFPFTVFAEVQPGPPSSVLELIFRHESLWRRAAEILTAKEVDLPALFLAVDRLVSDDPPAAATERTGAAYLARETVGTLTSDADPDAMRQSLIRVTRNLQRVARQVERDHRPPAYGLRFPLPPEPERATAARAVFLDMSLRVLGPKLRPALFWTEAGRDGYLDLHPGPVGPEAFLPLLSRSFPSDPVFAMDDDVAGPDGGEPRENPADACWAEPGLSLQDAVDRCGSSSGWRP